MPIESSLPDLYQQKYNNRFSRVAKKAFVNGHKCWIVAIEVGNGDFSDLLPGLETSYVTYALFVGQTVFKMDDAEIKMSEGFVGNSLTLNNYIPDSRPHRATFEGKHQLNLNPKKKRKNN